jgi:hypothetical protein
MYFLRVSQQRTYFWMIIACSKQRKYQYFLADTFHFCDMFSNTSSLRAMPFSKNWSFPTYSNMQSFKNLKIHYCNQKTLSLDPTLQQLKPVHKLLTYLSYSLISSSHLCQGLPNSHFISHVLTKTSLAFLISTHCGHLLRWM